MCVCAMNSNTRARLFTPRATGYVGRSHIVTPGSPERNVSSCGSRYSRSQRNISLIRDLGRLGTLGVLWVQLGRSQQTSRPRTLEDGPWSTYVTVLRLTKENRQPRGGARVCVVVRGFCLVLFFGTSPSVAFPHPVQQQARLDESRYSAIGQAAKRGSGVAGSTHEC